MKVIGITGPTGSGKGEVCKIFSELGFFCIDADAVSRIVTEKGSPCLWELENEFGNILDDNGELCRKVLASIAFANEESLERVSSITHKYILKYIEDEIDRVCNLDYRGVCIDGAALIESGFDKYCDFVISVIADATTRKNRIIKRDNLSLEDAHARIAVQKGDDFYIDNSHFTIQNDGDTNTLRTKVLKIINEIEQAYEI